MSGSLQYVGHGTVLVELDGVRVLTDPLLRRRVAHLRRTVALDRSAADALAAVLVSHGHFDHLDLPSLRRLARDVTLVVPRGLGPLLRRRRFSNVIEVTEGDEVQVGPLTIRATPADHEETRPPFGRAQPVGFSIHGSATVYFAGDTDLFDEMDGLVQDLDVALLPVWGWGPTLGRGRHLDPERAAEAVWRLRPRLAVPIHWGTYAVLHRALRRPPSGLDEPPRAFARAVERLGLDVEVRVLAPGETTRLDPRA